MSTGILCVPPAGRCGHSAGLSGKLAAWSGFCSWYSAYPCARTPCTWLAGKGLYTSPAANSRSGKRKYRAVPGFRKVSQDCGCHSGNMLHSRRRAIVAALVYFFPARREAVRGGRTRRIPSLRAAVRRKRYHSAYSRAMSCAPGASLW